MRNAALSNCPWLLGLALLAALAAAPAEADVRPNPLFSDHAVLQQEIKIPVWGTADDGEAITVELIQDGKAVQSKQTTASGGTWRVDLDPAPAGGPYTLNVSGKNKVEINDVLLGEVWLASGQSNMQWPVRQSADPERIMATAADQPTLRLFTVPRKGHTEPQSEVDARWQLATPETVGDFSAVAYAFARALGEARGAPIGIISTNYGGTPAEAWTSREKLRATPEAAALADSVSPDPHSGASLYNAMIAPLTPYAIRGAIWYQGESNAGRAKQYRTLFPAMIADWRERWGQGDFAFLLVQLAPFQKIVEQPGDSAWAELREAQLLATQKLPKVGMAVITDVGEEEDIHPKQKEPVGQRLALAARALAYNENLEHSGPVYRDVTFEDGKAVLSFDHIGGGLVARGGPLQGFSVAGADGKFVNAEAEIVGDTIVVHSPQVPEPAAVRFGWANYPVVNLWNKAGLPATPFRTDDFPLTTQ